MRQFFSWRIWLALAALIGLVVLLRMMLPAGAREQPAVVGPPYRMVDFVSFVYQVQPGSRFFMVDGRVNGSADVIIDGQRTMHLTDGTLGTISCPDFQEIGTCVVVADLLGDAVIWFELVPVQPGYKVHAAPIAEIKDDGIVRLENGWLVRTAASVDRRCDTETGSLGEFVRDVGAGSTTVIDVATQEVTAVVCTDVDQSSTTTIVSGASSTSSVLPASGVPATSTSIVDPADPAADVVPGGTVPQEG